MKSVDSKVEGAKIIKSSEYYEKAEMGGNLFI